MALILLIDDDNSVRTVLRLILVRWGHTVIEAVDGEQGLELFAHTAADLVLTDMILPGQGGLDVIRVLRKIRPRLKIIAMSGGGPLDEEESLHAARRDGAADVLLKPFAYAQLRSMIDRVLASAG